VAAYRKVIESPTVAVAGSTVSLSVSGLTPVMLLSRHPAVTKTTAASTQIEVHREGAA